MNQSVESTSLTPQLLSLDELLSDAMQAHEEEKRVKKAREQVKKGGIPPSERDATTMLIRSWEAKREWKPQANVAVFEYVVCACCGQENINFIGLMQKQVHRTNARTTRLIKFAAGQEMDASLPKIVARQSVETDICEYCAGDAGWDIQNPEIEL